MAHPRVLESDIGNELCLLHRDTNELLVLNETAADIWRLIDGRTRPQLVRALAEAYARPVEDIRADVDDVLRRLDSGGFVATLDANNQAAL